MRGYTVCAALCDEIAFWRSDESANPDHEVLEALRPAMATVPGAVMLCASARTRGGVRCGTRIGGTMRRTGQCWCGRRPTAR